MANDLLFFGTQGPGGSVTGAEWSEFLAASVTPRFPEGFTAWDAAGQWKSRDGALVREPSHVLNLVHDGGARDEAAIGAIVGEYKSRFNQESVMRVATSACVTF